MPGELAFKLGHLGTGDSRQLSGDEKAADRGAHGGVCHNAYSQLVGMAKGGRAELGRKFEAGHEPVRDADRVGWDGPARFRQPFPVRPQTGKDRSLDTAVALATDNTPAGEHRHPVPAQRQAISGRLPQLAGVPQESRHGPGR